MIVYRSCPDFCATSPCHHFAARTVISRPRMSDSVDGAARLRRGPHRRQPHPKPSRSQNVCGPGGADDWTRINNSEVARRAISRIEARGKGILLLHDIHPRTVLARPEILPRRQRASFRLAMSAMQTQ
jgi:hypothetical protein